MKLTKQEIIEIAKNDTERAMDLWHEQEKSDGVGDFILGVAIATITVVIFSLLLR